MLPSLSRCLAFILLLSGLGLHETAGGPEDELEDEALGATTQEITYNGHDYLMVTTPATWYQARSYCIFYDGASGYHLATINDPYEESFLNSLEAGLGKSRWWIGYSDAAVEGTWSWEADSSSHLNWAPGEPDNQGNQDCAVDRFDGSDGWDDQSCYWTNVFICERDSIPSNNKGTYTYPTLSNTNSATVNTQQFSIYLSAGQLFTMGTCGVPGASGSGDTWLRLRNPSGVEIASNDDAHGSCGILSNISITVPTTGTYAMHAGCYSSSACSGTIAVNY